MKRPGYREAIRWIIDNDDNEWLDDDNDPIAPIISVTAALVADLFDVETSRIIRDLRKAKERKP